MPHYIIKIKDKYFEWSTIVDAPITYGMTLRQLEKYIKAEYGNNGLEDLPQRLERVAEYGTSAAPYATLEELVEYNRAGENETRLTIDEIYEKYK